MRKKKSVPSKRFIVSGTIALLSLAASFSFVFKTETASVFSVIKEAGFHFASIVLAHDPRSIKELQRDYKDKEVRILIVPGHEPNYGGAEFGGIKERDLNLELAEELEELLRDDNHFEVIVARDSDAWHSDLEEYFIENWDEIGAWENALREEFSTLIANGEATKTYSPVGHGVAGDSVRRHLYGINKWSNEEEIDIAIHIHFNDNVRSSTSVPGEYSGFAIYVPEKQYGNSRAAKAIADSIFDHLAVYNPVSDLPGESVGVIDDPELIALGVNNSADAASLLIEYSYVYEPQLHDAGIRSILMKDLALETYIGLLDFFDNDAASKLEDGRNAFLESYSFNTESVGEYSNRADIFALQTALMREGFYPPAGNTKNDCPRTGMFGDCTRSALQLFQRTHGIQEEFNAAGRETLKVLEER